MLGHQLVVAVDVDGLAALLRELHRQLERETVRGGEHERVLSRDRLPPGEVVEQLHPALERFRKALFLVADGALDLAGVLHQLGVRLTGLLDHDRRQPVDVAQPDAARLLHCAPDDPPQDVASPLVRRHDAVADEERHPTRVVGKNAVRLGRRRRVAVGHARLARDPFHDPLVAVRLVDGHHVLHDRARTLEAHARIDVLLGQRRQRAVRVELVLHEDEVPELEEALAARAARPAVGLAAAVLLAPVVVDLGVGTARPRPTHGPEVLRCRQQHDALARHSGLLPQLDRDVVGAEAQLRVAGEDADPDAIPVQLEVLTDEFRGKLDRPLFEVLPEREVSEHLEEREVRAVQPDLVDIGRTEAFLHRRRQLRGRLLASQEERHLGLHAGRGQQGRAVVRARDEDADGQRR